MDSLRKKEPGEDIPATTLPDEFLPFTRPSIDAADIAAVVAVLESGWITSGAKVKELEQAVCAATGCQHAVAVISATAGMHLMLHALDIGPGDEVITPSLTWVSTINLISLCGATPVFVDVDRDTLMTDAARVEAAITPRTKLIIPVDFGGAAFDMDPLMSLAAKHGIPVVEDAAHALGATCKGLHVGHSGTAIFSFQAIKNVTTAEGGMICTDDAELAERLRRLRFHGLGADAFDRLTHGRAPNAEVIEPGYKYNLPDMNACLGLGQLHRLDQLIQSRANIAETYLHAFDADDRIMPLGFPDHEFTHAWHLFVIRLDLDALTLTRDQFIELLKLRQIGAGVHFRAAHHHKYYRESQRYRASSLDNTDWNSSRLVTLPLFPAMRPGDIERVVTNVTNILDGNSK